MANQSSSSARFYKCSTIIICCINIVVALYVLHSFCASFYIFSGGDNASSDSYIGAKYSEEHIRKMVGSIHVRQASEPTELMKLIKKMEELFGEDQTLNISVSLKQKVTDEVLHLLKQLPANANLTEQRASLEAWHKEKLQEAKQIAVGNATSNLTITREEAMTLERILEADLTLLLENIGLWLPPEIINKENSDQPKNDLELEDDIIAGPPIPPDCHAEPHTDYDGAAVRWGLTHHKESAADCCKACLDQAKRAKPGEMKCNIWVYCPSENGCYSPDIYEHKHQECWLKQAEKPRLNFKDRYSDSYRSAHPTAPFIVPWMSGVVST
ncbi:hypothetical protein H6P81_011091 [Aristolochia fimbriata]|uniref:Uncharacterized protein n=1 Tax=Aristolochia fimbriata TaxID=158543 RepID=A0AAV7EU17_ARIFI|nr:hypothetical protein H6P81_011091 [Aristolochia fimbriata]